MGRLSARSNPTNLKEIPGSRINISVSEVAGQRYFTLSRLDLEGLDLAGILQVVCIPRAGKTSQRFEMGTVAAFRRDSIPLDDLDRTQSLRFRILLHEENNPQLVAAAESLRPMDDSQSESLLPMEPAELGERLWRLDVSEEGPVLKYNRMVFPSAAGVENYLPFAALVLSEALRRVMEEISEDPSRLDDEGDPLSAWSGWLDSIGAGRPSENKDEASEWCDRVVDIFCEHHRFASRLALELKSGGAHD